MPKGKGKHLDIADRVLIELNWLSPSDTDEPFLTKAHGW